VGGGLGGWGGGCFFCGLLLCGAAGFWRCGRGRRGGGGVSVGGGEGGVVGGGGGLGGGGEGGGGVWR